TGPSTPQELVLEACPLTDLVARADVSTISRIARGSPRCVHTHLEARLAASVVVAKNCEDSDMAILAMGNLGHYVNRPVTPGSHAVNLVLQILETR
ncbi:hypothetical protein, partial [Pseudomonas protegens]